MKHDDFLVEILTEELPPKHLLGYAVAFQDAIYQRLQKASLQFEGVHYFATPRRLAVLVKGLALHQPNQEIEKRGPTLQAAYDKDGKPSKALMGFAKAAGVEVDDLITIKNAQGEWLGVKQKIEGKSSQRLLPDIIQQSLDALPIKKRMRWSDHEQAFIRPVHSVVMLHGQHLIEGTLLGCTVNRLTKGHRFHAPKTLTILQASDYEALLEKEGEVIVDFAKRRALIVELAKQSVEKKLGKEASVTFSPSLLDEVTGLVEYPVALCGEFDAEFLNVPQEVLISSMQDHQRYFPVVDQEAKLKPYFVVISNLKSHTPSRVLHGNERVLRARLADAAFFYEVDKKERLDARVDHLKGMVFKAKLGTLYDKAMRLEKLSAYLAQAVQVKEELAKRSGRLAKADLTTQMVGEFPELQGVMASYYANHDGESHEVALALKEQYLPRFSGDSLPQTKLGQVLALADRLDTLVGAFGINQLPTGDKDPYGLRRAALSVLRILIEAQINLDLKQVLPFVIQHYGIHFENDKLTSQLLDFMQERLRAWYQEQGISLDVFAAVAALGLTDPFDIHKRIQAVWSFKKLTAAEALSVANKRVSNILSKYEAPIEAKAIDPQYFDEVSEKELAQKLKEKENDITKLHEAADYNAVLLQLAELRTPIDNFFDHVMVMTDDKPRRENRLLLLSELRSLFLKVADIALLQ